MNTMTMNAMRLRRVGAAPLFLLASACNGEPEEAEHDMSDMPGMAAPASDATGADDPMEAHMARMAALATDSLLAVLPTHRQMVANALARMNREMQSMAMPADSAWNATVEAIREDLTRMPEMGVTDLGRLMPAHRDRVERLMSMHTAMMRAMGM